MEFFPEQRNIELDCLSACNLNKYLHMYLWTFGRWLWCPRQQAGDGGLESFHVTATKAMHWLSDPLALFIGSQTLLRLLSLNSIAGFSWQFISTYLYTCGKRDLVSQKRSLSKENSTKAATRLQPLIKSMMC